jgi:sulfur-oxidizing protein SoxZ
VRLRRIIMPSSAKAGEIVEIRTVIVHPMITGHSAGTANASPRRIIHTFHVHYDGEEIFRAELGPGIAANPVLAFTTVATGTGDMVFTWVDDTGEVAVERRLLTVTAA